MRSAEAWAEPAVEPGAAETAAEYVALLRRVKDESGLTYRKIQRRAEAAGATLPPSTLATMLGRQTLPREDLVVALLTACGVAPDELTGWLRARQRIRALGSSAPYAGNPPATGRAAPYGGSPRPAATRQRIGSWLLLGTSAALGGVAVGLAVLAWRRAPARRARPAGRPLIVART